MGGGEALEKKPCKNQEKILQLSIRIGRAATVMRGDLAVINQLIRKGQTNAPDVVRCKSCGALIVFMGTTGPNPMPVDYQAHGEAPFFANTEFDKDLHVSHFATCPHAKAHRRPRK